MSEVTQYSMDQHIAVFGNQEILGFADGDVIKVARSKPVFTTKVGAKGDVTRVRTADKTGTIMITLQAGAASNDYLAGLISADESSGSSILPIMIKDLNGNFLVTAEKAWITKYPDETRGEDGPSREWEIFCAELIMVSGSASTGL